MTAAAIRARVPAVQVNLVQPAAPRAPPPWLSAPCVPLPSLTARARVRGRRGENVLELNSTNAAGTKLHDVHTFTS